jgi:hypothetical protein
LSPNPIGKVLSTLRKHRVRALLMGGQACILYGAAEFSRDVDVAVLASDANLDRLRRALDELRAVPVDFPPLATESLLRGHACHFRAGVKQAEGMRIDVMTVMHGCDPFELLWKRRRRLTLSGIGLINVLSLPDLVQAKKTQRDKDWPMVRRLIEIDYHRCSRAPSALQISFWLREARTAGLLIEICRGYKGTAKRLASQRTALRFAIEGNVLQVENALRQEEDAFRASDQAYWAPLKKELFQMRQANRGYNN